MLLTVVASFMSYVTLDRSGSLSVLQFFHPRNGGSDPFHLHVVRFTCANVWEMMRMVSGTQQILSQSACDALA